MELKGEMHWNLRVICAFETHPEFRKLLVVLEEPC